MVWFYSWYNLVSSFDSHTLQYYQTTEQRKIPSCTMGETEPQHLWCQKCSAIFYRCLDVKNWRHAISQANISKIKKKIKVTLISKIIKIELLIRIVLIFYCGNTKSDIKTNFCLLFCFLSFVIETEYTTYSLVWNTLWKRETKSAKSVTAW